MDYPFIDLHYEEPVENPMVLAEAFFQKMKKRRSVRDFSAKPVPLELIRTLISTAGTAPSGANKQPWTFVVVGNSDIKKQIREAAEKEEFESYQHRMPKEWLEDLAPLGTDWRKPFLEIAPWLVIIFKRINEVKEGKTRKNYYVNESVGLAAGFFIAAAHQAGLVTLTHTPSPMDFLTKILHRPENERPFLLIPVGYPEIGAKVPDIQKKPVEDIIQVF